MDIILFIFLCVICGSLVFYDWQQKSQGSSSSNGPSMTPSFRSFQWKYLIPYFIMTASDWLQGPYVYALYKSYGFTIGQIGLLFIIGFGSSMVFGTIVGSFSDKFGRKWSCMMFAVCYTIACLTKHSHDFTILTIGRLMGGISTSILFSAFESWMVSEHFKHQYSSEWLSNTFYMQVFGNSCVAILSGLVASFVTSTFETMVAPFDTAVVLLVIGGSIIFFMWSENYGDSTVDITHSFVAGLNAIRNDRRVACLAISQSMFEAAMYIFVFMWSPTLDAFFSDYSHGLVFSCFMVSTMIGSTIFNLLSRQIELENLLLYIFLVSIVALAIPVFVHSGVVVLMSFLLFELCVGMFWPNVSTLKGMYIPEDVRATVMNYFRIPTNLFVLLTLNQVQRMSHDTVFLVCVLLLTVSTVAQMLLVRLAGNQLILFEKKNRTMSVFTLPTENPQAQTTEQ